MDTGGLSHMAYNTFNSNNQLGVPTSGFTTRRGSTIKSLSFGQSNIADFQDNCTPTPRTSRSHLLAGLRTAPKNAANSVPMTAPPTQIEHNIGYNSRYMNENNNYCGPKSSTFLGPQNVWGVPSCNSQLYTMPEHVLAPPEIQVDANGYEQMDNNYYSQLIATNKYLAEQQQRLQQQLINVQAAAHQFQGMSLGNLQSSTPPITPQSLYQQQQLKYSLQSAGPNSNSLPIYSCYNSITGQPTYFQLNEQTRQFDKLQSGQNFANYSPVQKAPFSPRIRDSMLPTEAAPISRSASPAKPQSPDQDHNPLPPPSAGAFRRSHRSTPSYFALHPEENNPADMSKTNLTYKHTSTPSAFGPGQARAGEHPIRQPRGPPSIDILVAKPTTKFEGSKNFATRTRRTAVNNLVRAGNERRKTPGSVDSGSTSPNSEAGEVTFSVADNDSDSGGSGSGSLSSRPALGSPRTSIHGAIGSNRPSSRQNRRFLERKSVASLDSSYTSASVSGDEGGSLGGKFAVVIKNGARQLESDNLNKKAPMLILTPAGKQNSYL